jgi:hypothetical protein
MAEIAAIEDRLPAAMQGDARRLVGKGLRAGS